MSSSSFEADFDVASRIAHVQPVRGLREKVHPRHTALVVIDMQNDFIADDGLIAREGRDVSQAKEMAEHLPKLIEAARAAGVFVVFVRNVYTSEQNFYLSDVWLEQAARKRAGGYTRIPVCAAGSWGGDFYGDVRPEPNDPIVTKHRYSAFYNTDLDTILRANGTHGGLHGRRHQCLLRDQRARGFRPRLLCRGGEGRHRRLCAG
jgi:isochorismate hydrolase